MRESKRQGKKSRGEKAKTYALSYNAEGGECFLG